MTLLFLIALALAWPTSGLSILIFLCILFGNSYFTAKARISRADRLRANRSVINGSRRAPSWASDDHERFIFLSGVQKLVERERISDTALETLFDNGDFIRMLMTYAAEIEAQGSSFVEQQLAVAEKIVDYCDSLEVRKKVQNESF